MEPPAGETEASGELKEKGPSRQVAFFEPASPSPSPCGHAGLTSSGSAVSPASPQSDLAGENGGLIRNGRAETATTTHRSMTRLDRLRTRAPLHTHPSHPADGPYSGEEFCDWLSEEDRPGGAFRERGVAPRQTSSCSQPFLPCWTASPPVK